MFKDFKDFGQPQNFILDFFVKIKNCKILARFVMSCKKSFIFSARLARYMQGLVQDLASLVRKILARIVHFLQDSFYWVVFTKRRRWSYQYSNRSSCSSRHGKEEGSQIIGSQWRSHKLIKRLGTIHAAKDWFCEKERDY